ncbi:hypothetical protein HDU92_000896 [Lobulomyces angularis]|nr:hypothetical protein HDU92_000896 [Lobulomyces angularis]
MEEKRELKVKLRSLKPEVNKLIKNWEFETPKDIRVGGVKEVFATYKGNFTKLSKRMINYFLDSLISVPEQTKFCGVDPGIRDFLTVHSNSKFSNYTQHQDKLKKIRSKIELLKRKRIKKKK